MKQVISFEHCGFPHLYQVRSHVALTVKYSDITHMRSSLLNIEIQNQLHWNRRNIWISTSFTNSESREFDMKRNFQIRNRNSRVTSMLLVAWDAALFLGYSHDGPGVYLDRGQKEAEGIATQSEDDERRFRHSRNQKHTGDPRVTKSPMH